MAAVENPEVMYLNAKLYVKPENQKEFIALSPLYAEVIFENYGYQLVHASYPITGDVHVFNHIWRVPKDAPLAGVMIATAKEAEREAEREAKLGAVDTAIAGVRKLLRGATTKAPPEPSGLDDVRNTLATSGAPRASRHGVAPLRLTFVDARRQALHAEYEKLGSSAGLQQGADCLCKALGDGLQKCEYAEPAAQAEHSARGLRAEAAKATVLGAAQRNAVERAEAADALAALAAKFALAALEVAEHGGANPVLAEFYVEQAEELVDDAREHRQIEGVPAPFTRIQLLIEHTEQDLMTALPYDPLYFGFQSQSILVDTEGELWLLEHEDLRQRQASLQGKPDGAYTATEAELRGLLQQGATVGILREGDEKALLFNLAGLQPKSVFQHRKPPTNGSLPDKGFTLPGGDGHADLPRNVKAVYVATTWGDIYRLTGKDIEAIATPLHGATVGDTPKLIEKLVAARVPLAAVPEVRDQPVGWGYYCYVINLASFVSRPKGAVPASFPPSH